MAGTGNRIAIARFGAAHGIRGEVRVKPYGDDPLALSSYGPLETRDGSAHYEILTLRPQKSMVVARIKGVNDRNAAEALNGIELFVSRDRLPEPADDDEFYHADLIGMAAVTPENDALGAVSSVQNFGAGDLLEIKPKGGASFYVPFTRAFVPEIEVKERRVVVVLPDDYFSDEADAETNDPTEAG